MNQASDFNSILEYADELTKDVVIEEPKEEKIIQLTKVEFDALLSYDVSIPTGTLMGKRWKRRRWDPARACAKCASCKMGIKCGRGWIDEWDMGEFVPDPGKGMIGIAWKEIKVVD